MFYREFGSLMMRQPLIGFEFTTYAPLVLVPYVLLLLLNVFNRAAAFFTRSPTLLFEDDWETQSPYATSGTRLLQIELENFAAGRPMGLTISPQGDLPFYSAHTPPPPSPRGQGVSRFVISSQVTSMSTRISLRPVTSLLCIHHLAAVRL